MKMLDERLEPLAILVDKCSPRNEFSEAAFREADKERLKMAKVTSQSEEWYHLSCRLGRYEISCNPKWPEVRLTSG